MDVIKKNLKRVLILSVSIILLIGIYLLAAFILSRIATDAEANEQHDVTIYIATNGVHTDIVVPVKNEQINWSKYVAFENTKSNDTTMRYLSMGWGDRGFYLEAPTWGDLKFKTAFNAAFGLSKTAIHTTFCKNMTEDQTCVKTVLSKEQYQRLINYIQLSFEKSKTNGFMHIQTNANYGINDAFYEAKGTYSLFHTCNTWANNALKSCGQKACFWTPFDTGIFYHYQK